jgi:hypothetical protein
MALKMISLLLLGTLNAEAMDSNEAAKAMSKFVQVPATSMARPSVTVDNGATFATASDAMLETVADLEKQSQELKAEYQGLRARVEKLSQADVNASISAPSSSLGFAALVASLGLAATMGVAAVKKYMGQGRQGSESATAFQIPLVARAPQRAGPIVMESLSDLQQLQEDLPGPPGYWDPLSLAEQTFAISDVQGEEATIGWLRHAEIKHGRVAMAGFLGFCAHCTPLVSGEHTILPYRGYVAGVSPQEQWDNIPLYGKLQILVLVGMLESYGEGAGDPDGYVHYMKGGKPGYFPPIAGRAGPGGQVNLDLWDPFKLVANTSAEKNARGLKVEILNGRLAMIGLFSLLAESAVPGSVPPITLGLEAAGIDSFPQYSGNIMVPFSNDFSLLEKFSS